ncbi:2-succinyl-5-enolpyruvyl-6-hydroxy-3-cyclohexene-1-carboxylate synthase [Microbacterium luticocti]|uniref:2-succinyl-5-enolpyruvyl-6-hydroxy-3- cyclohexene-1-carboxylate synthase n=1 Tax=Microbacterium luticocti TaxID=451764 RepID=UPI0003FB2698|nr:2-succinyl-5-enolpyruvyl-6-hydroxy-3-cyclohexene-1-carboxylate synthase [Microbacterium luticocti]
MPADRAPATDAAAALLARLVARGLRHIVLSPGSRSQALALVAAELERRNLVQLHVRIDERVAGFTALGIGRESGMPAAVVCTSGTATANLLPAVMEADHAGVPLLLLTADRPPELRGIGANQTTRQPGMFAAHVRWWHDLPVPDATAWAAGQAEEVRACADRALDAALGAAPGALRGPVHLNLPYREPLSGRIDLEVAIREQRADTPPRVDAEADDGRGHIDAEADDRMRRVEAEAVDGMGRVDAEAVDGMGRVDAEAVDRRGRIDAEAGAPLMLRPGPRTVVVAGADAGEHAERLAHEAGWPLIAEIVSGARYGRHLVHGYRALLRDPTLGGRIQRAIVFGHPTLSREVTALLSRRDIEVIAVDGPGERLDLNGATRAVASVAAPEPDGDRDWLGEWMRASRAQAVDLAPPAPDAAGLASTVPRERLGAIAAEVDALHTPLTRELLVDAVWRASWPHDRLVFGSSRLVRVADGILPGKKVPVHANRGLAGIDGTVATAIGVAAASPDAGITRVLLGDLALLHDVGALLLPDDEQAPRVQIVVGNDGGGTIFDGLEVASTADPAALRRVMYTPQSVRIAELAAGYGWQYVRATTRAELDQALTAGHRAIIEVPLDR